MPRENARAPNRDRIGFRLPVEILDRLRDYCERNNLVVTSIVEDCLTMGLDALEKKERDAKRKPGVFA